MPSKKHGLTLSALVAAGALASATISAFAADDDFVNKAAMGGLAEVSLGQDAQQKGSSDAVKQFGQKMVDDHSKANSELKSIAEGKNMSVPAKPDASQRRAQEKLDKTSGVAYDQAFKAQMIKDHKATIALFQKEAKSGKDQDLKTFAQKTLPTIEEHLRMAQSL